MSASDQPARESRTERRPRVGTQSFAGEEVEVREMIHRILGLDGIDESLRERLLQLQTRLEARTR